MEGGGRGRGREGKGVNEQREVDKEGLGWGVEIGRASCRERVSSPV